MFIWISLALYVYEFWENVHPYMLIRSYSAIRDLEVGLMQVDFFYIGLDVLFDAEHTKSFKDEKFHRFVFLNPR